MSELDVSVCETNVSTESRGSDCLGAGTVSIRADWLGSLEAIYVDGVSFRL